MRSLIFLIFFHSHMLLGLTKQQPDFLNYNGENLTVDIGWGHPSPLEVYFYKNQIKYPFQSLHTANYRGHQASWKIKNDSLFLEKVVVVQEDVDFSQYITEMSLVQDDGMIFSNWFSGVILSTNKQSKYYFHIRDGKIIQSEEINNKDDTALSNGNYHLISKPKKRILVLYENYLSYYFRLGTEEVFYQNETCQLYTGASELSPFFGLFDYSHLKWPYNWENLRNSGSPNCKWDIRDGKLFLKTLEIHRGLSFDSVERKKLDIYSFLDKPVNDNGVFADWVNGIILLNHGKQEADELIPEVKYFKTTHFSFLRLKNGNVIEAYKLNKNFNFDKIPRKTDKKLKALLNEYKLNH